MKHSLKQVAVRIVACFITLILIFFTARSFEAKAAAGSAKRTLLDPALVELAKCNPDDAQNILDLADELRKSGDTTGALQVLQTSSIGKNHWQGWQRQGILWEQVADAPLGNVAHLHKAMANFDRVTKVHPYYTPALEHCGSLALKLKDWEKVAAVADELEQIDFNNLGANYLRSCLATALGETTNALTLLRLLSNQKGYPSSLFTRDNLHSKIETLERKLKP